jgi:hypothetical protein
MPTDAPRKSAAASKRKKPSTPEREVTAAHPPKEGSENDTVPPSKVAEAPAAASDELRKFRQYMHSANLRDLQGRRRKGCPTRKKTPEERLRQAIDSDVLYQVEQSGLRKKLRSFNPIAVAGKRAGLLDGFDRIPLRVLGEMADVYRVAEAIHIRRNYKGRWGTWPAYMYRCLIRALGLWEYESELLRLAEPKRGRKQNRDLAERVLRLYGEGKNTSQIQAVLKADGKELTTEAIREYRKARRRK